MPRSDLEHLNQAALFSWAKSAEKRYPELQWMFAVPNAAKRSVRLAARMKAEGLKSGVPDILLPVARMGYHGLFIEMKAPKGRLSENQEVWLAGLCEQGYKSVVCCGWEVARDTIIEYLGMHHG